MSSFSRLATVTASTERRPISGVIESNAVAVVTSMQCLPLDPVSPETIRRTNMTTPINMLETYVEGDLDIHSGDVLVVGASRYDIRIVANYTWRETHCLHLVVEAKK